ncbi:LysR substrate-binding domain-containing protein [Spirosoma sp. SC4-14]|uniref:LysR substrate-binding domain-containing protein n=1 Tax=Spirosoma sp. SC4-14 TaxID=3128900 RepID=UPI0030CEDA38
MDIYQLKHFLVLADTLNYRRTAERIFIAQPALSRQIQQLESELGALLFKRDKRTVTLTPAGLYLQQEAGRLLEQLDQTFKRTAQIHRGEAGEIRIGHASSAMQSVLPKLLISIREQTPDLKALLMETTNRYQLEALQNREIDVGFSPNVITPPSISSRVVYAENFVVLLPENHPIAVENFTDLSVLAQESFILPPQSEGNGYVESIQALCQQYGFLPHIAYESAYSGTVLRLVEAGMGISIEPISTLRGQNLRIKTIELTNLPQKAEMRLLWLTERTTELAPFLRLVDRIL